MLERYNSDYPRTLDVLDRMVQRSFATLTEYERITHGSDPPMLLPAVLDLINSGEADGTHPVVGRLVTWRDASAVDLDAVIAGHLCTVVVFFMPGTRDDASLYVGNEWDNTWVEGADETRKDVMEGRIKKIAEQLKRHKHEFKEEPQCYEVENFFFCPYLHAKALGKYLADGHDLANAEKLDGNAGFSCHTLWDDSTMADSEYVIPEINHRVVWKKRDDANYAPMLATPMFVNEDSMVLVATFLEREVFDACREDNTAFRRLMFCHRVCAHDVFGNLYGALLRGAMAGLRTSLDRAQISPALLRAAAQNLGGENGTFTYKWGATQTLADLESDIYGNVLHDPTDVFNHVLDIETEIYAQLVDDWPSPKLGGADCPLPPKEEMPLADLLKGFEQANRALKTTRRDHVSHQFQVFLLGCLVIRTHEPEFRKCFAATLGDLNIWGLEDVSPESDECGYLLRLAWFMCSTLHDVGYPVQLVDGTMNRLRTRVAELLALDARHIGINSRLEIGQVLYDDPRAYILLKALTRKLPNVDDTNFEGWWYFIRNLAFARKHHAASSVISLTMNLLNKGDHADLLSAENFMDKPFGKFLARHILTPVLHHHVYDWEEEEKKIIDLDTGEESDGLSKQERKKREKLREDRGKRIRRALATPRKLYRIAENVSKSPPKASYRGHRIRLKENPLCVLLALCDILQETGRPSGDSEDHWPARFSDEIECSTDGERGRLKFALNLIYTGDDSKKCREDCMEKRMPRVNRFRRIFGISGLSHFKVTVQGKHETTKEEWPIWTAEQ